MMSPSRSFKILISVTAFVTAQLFALHHLSNYLLIYKGYGVEPSFMAWLIFSTLWFTLCAWEHKNELGKIGIIGYVLSLATFASLLVRFHLADYTMSNFKFTLWPSIMLIYGAWGFLYFGMALFRAGKYPRLAILLWTICYLMEFSGRAFHWKERVYLGFVGLIWCGVYVWIRKDKKEDSDQLDPQLIGKTRLVSWDLYRGLIMTFMALDHFASVVTMHHPYEFFNSSLPSYFGSISAFLTRFVTHFCAPGFFFLMGAAMIYYALSRFKLGWSNSRIIKTLMLRGILIILLERIIWNPIIFGSVNGTVAGVLFGLGGTMIIGSLFLRLNSSILFGLGVIGIIFTQFLPDMVMQAGIYFNPLSILFLLPNMSKDWFIIYPILPWLSISFIGMAYAQEMAKNKDRTQLILLISGLGAIVLFVSLRLLGGFGNIQMDNASGVIGFFNVVKYPPSLTFTLLTLGVGAIVIYLLDRYQDTLKVIHKPFLVLGQTALFFYFVHWLFYRSLGGFFYLVRGGLEWVYPVWIVGLMILFPLCAVYLKFKQNTSPDSLWRAF